MGRTPMRACEGGEWGSLRADKEAPCVLKVLALGGLGVLGDQEILGFKGY